MIQISQSQPPETDASSADLLEKSLLDLRSSDADLRLAAFDSLRGFGNSTIREAYQQYRQTTPDVGWETDCLERLVVEQPYPPIECDRCICTVISPGYEAMLEAMLDTLVSYGQSPEARIVVFAIDGSFEALTHRSEITPIRCRSIERPSAAVKGALYSAARFIKSNYFVTLEVDMLIVGSLQPLWAALEVTHSGALMGARHTSLARRHSLKTTLSSEELRPDGLEFLTGNSSMDCPFWFNGGLIAGDQKALLSLDAEMRRLAPNSILWMEGSSKPSFAYGDEFLLNLCIGLINNPVEIGTCLNQQVYNSNRKHWLQTRTTFDGLEFRQGGGHSRVLHFISSARKTMWEVKAEIAAQTPELLLPGADHTSQAGVAVAQALDHLE